MGKVDQWAVPCALQNVYKFTEDGLKETVAVPLSRSLERKEVKGLTEGFKGSWWEILP